MKAKESFGVVELPAGTVVHVNGIPMHLAAATPVLTSEGNLALAAPAPSAGARSF